MNLQYSFGLINLSFWTFLIELSQYLGGAILFEETLFQKTAAGKPFAELLKEHGIAVGIKVDKVIP